MQESQYIQTTKLYLRIYHVALVLMQLCAMSIMPLIALIFAKTENAFEDEQFLTMSILIGAFAFVFLVIHVIGLVLVGKQTKANWVFQLVLICFGMTSLLTLPFCIFILLRLINPEVKNYYNAA